MIKCELCGGTNIETKFWVNPNTKEVISEVENEGDTDDNWCRDCQEHVSFDFEEDAPVNKEFGILKIISKDINTYVEKKTIIDINLFSCGFDDDVKKFWDIYSIVRLSDNVIFTIGDRVNNPKLQKPMPFVILKFYMDCNNNHLLCGNGHINITKIKHYEMTLDESILTLEKYNNWRTGDDSEMIHPRLITEAIEIAIHQLKQLK